MSVFWFERSVTDVPEANDWLSEKEQSYLGALRFSKRRDDWRLGRWTAKCSVASSLGLPGTSSHLSQIEIWPGRSGAPEVFFAQEPAHLAISLSHRAGKAVCAVAPFQARIGCDLELIESRHPAFLSDYFATDEQALVAHTAPDRRDFTITLLWSGKESALKALHLGLRLDTRSLHVCLTESPPQSRDFWLDSYPLRLLNSHTHEPEPSDLWHPFQVLFRDVPTFVGWWRNPDDLVRTVVLAHPSAPEFAHTSN